VHVFELSLESSGLVQESLLNVRLVLVQLRSVGLNETANLVNIGVGGVYWLNDFLVIVLDFILRLGVVVQEVHPVHHVIIVFSNFTTSFGLDLLKEGLGLN